MPEIDDPSLNYQQAARYLNVSVNTIKRETYAGKIAYAKLRGRVTFKRSDLDAYRNERTIQATRRREPRRAK
jgi:excisionase family DNA binding protein